MGAGDINRMYIHNMERERVSGTSIASTYTIWTRERILGRITVCAYIQNRRREWVPGISTACTYTIWRERGCRGHL